MYETFDDPYCYGGTSVLRNRLDIRSPKDLDEFEAEITAQRADEPLPAGRFSASHYCNLHRHLFQDVYVWAGRYRTVRISKGDTTFCYPEHIDREMKKLFAGLKAEKALRGLTRNVFSARMAHFLSELNAIHPFREGNGRTQNSFLVLLAEQAGHPLNLEPFEKDRVLHAMIAGMNGSETPLKELILEMCEG